MTSVSDSAARWTDLRNSATLVVAVALFFSYSGVRTVHAQPSFGTATVEQGRMLLVRGEQRFEYAAGDPSIVIVYGDVLTVRELSRVSVHTTENVNLTLGGNSVFQAKPFNRNGQRGVLRMLFGRLRASLVSLVGAEQFSVKTAQGTIGVKGTEFFTSVTAQGDTLVAVKETDHVVTLAGLDGPERSLTQDLMAVVLNNKPVSVAAVVTPDLRQEIAVDVLESPAAFAAEARELPAERALVREGIVSEADLVEAKRERVTLDDIIDRDEQIEPLRDRYELSPESSQDVFRRQFLLPPQP